MFKNRIAHGMLSAGLISAVLEQIARCGHHLVVSDFNFKLSVYIGNTITAKVTVVEKKERFRLRLLSANFNRDGKAAVTGEAEAMLKGAGQKN